MTRLVQWAKWLGDHRDSLLVLSALIYVLGYAVWSINALRFDLGLLPAFDFQYLLAGSVPFVIALLAYLAAGFLRALLSGVRARIAAHKRVTGAVRRAFNVVVILLIGIPTFLPLLSTLDELLGGSEATEDLVFEGRAASVIGVVYGSLVVAAFLLGALLPPREPADAGAAEPGGEDDTPTVDLWWTRDWASDFAGAGSCVSAALSVVLSALAGLALIVLFVFVVYPKLPQELGGVKPRCAQLEVISGAVSPTTLYALAPKQAFVTDDTPQDVVRTEPVSIYYSRPDSLLVKRRDTGDERTYELVKDAVRATITC